MPARLAVVIGLLLVGCGSGETPITPEPVAPPPTEPAPTPTPTPTADPAPSPTPPSEPSAEPAPPPAPRPTVPPAPAGSRVELVLPPTDGMAPGGALALTAGTINMFHTDIALDVVAYPPEVQEAIVSHLRGALREDLEVVGFEPGGDPEFPNTLFGACRALVALPELVSYACHLDLEIGRGGGDFVSDARTWEVRGTALRELETDDLLVAGADEDLLSSELGIAIDDPVGLGADGLVYVTQDGTLIQASYADLGTLLNPGSVVVRVPAALAASTVPGRFSEAAAPPTEWAVLDPAIALPAGALLAARLDRGWIFSGSGAAIDATATVLVSAPDGTPPSGMTRRMVPWSTPARLVDGRLRRATALRPAARGRAAGPILPAGTAVVGVLGDLVGGSSRTSAGQFTFVVASESSFGWIPAGLFGDEVEGMAAGRDAFATALPAADQAGARARAMMLAAGDDGLVGLFEGEPGTTTLGYLERGTSGRGPTIRMLVTHPGSVVEAHAVRMSAWETATHVMVGWQVPGDESHVQWELYRVPTAGGLTAGAPVLSLTLALPTAPERERQTVAYALTRHGTFYPVVVRGPGRAEALYTWNGSALVPPAAE